LFGHLREAAFAFKFTLRSQQPDIFPIICPGVIDTGGKFAAGVVDTGGKLVSLTQAASIVIMVTNLPPVSTTLAKLVAKFATNVVDTGGAP